MSGAAVGTAQATELVHGPLAAGLPVVLTCDCNATPGSAPYAAFTGAGLQDSWMQALNRPGFRAYFLSWEGCCVHASQVQPGHEG